jgi:hypothetical protein
VFWLLFLKLSGIAIPGKSLSVKSPIADAEIFWLKAD